MSTPFTYRTRGRSRRTLVVVGVVWLALLVLWLGLQANVWIVLFLALFTLPACWDLIADPPSGFELSDRQISWFSGKRQAQVQLDEVNHVHLNTRLDFSVKATLVLTNGAKLRLPFEATPPDQALEAALTAQGIAVKRTHFQLIQ